MPKYRVTLEGFVANNQTWNHWLEIDGKRDEVYVHADVRLVNKDGNTLLRSEVRTPVMSDVNTYDWCVSRVRPGRVRNVGGLTGNPFPGDRPWNKTSAQLGYRRLYHDRFPMLLFEGQLSAGQHAVVITPTIWECDGGSDMFNDWSRTLATNAPKVVGATTNIINGHHRQGDFLRTNLEMGLPALFSLTSTIFGQGGDRPIGMEQAGDRYVFNPKLVVLTQQTADLAATTKIGGTVNGVHAINFIDSSRLAGNYSLFMRIEQMELLSS